MGAGGGIPGIPGGAGAGAGAGGAGGGVVVEDFVLGILLYYQKKI